MKHLNPDSDFFKKQCNLVKDASDFLLNVQIPAFLRECRDHSAAPMDGQTLSDGLHHRGINIRYLGVIANLVGFSTSSLAAKIVLIIFVPASALVNLHSFFLYFWSYCYDTNYRQMFDAFIMEY